MDRGWRVRGLGWKEGERFRDDSKILYFHTFALFLRRLMQVVMIFTPFYRCKSYSVRWHSSAWATREDVGNVLRLPIESFYIILES